MVRSSVNFRWNPLNTYISAVFFSCFSASFGFRRFFPGIFWENGPGSWQDENGHEVKRRFLHIIEKYMCIYIYTYIYTSNIHIYIYTRVVYLCVCKYCIYINDYYIFTFM